MGSLGRLQGAPPAHYGGGALPPPHYGGGAPPHYGGDAPLHGFSPEMAGPPGMSHMYQPNWVAPPGPDSAGRGMFHGGAPPPAPPAPPSPFGTALDSARSFGPAGGSSSRIDQPSSLGYSEQGGTQGAYAAPGGEPAYGSASRMSYADRIAPPPAATAYSQHQPGSQQPPAMQPPAMQPWQPQQPDARLQQPWKQPASSAQGSLTYGKPLNPGSLSSNDSLSALSAELDALRASGPSSAGTQRGGANPQWGANGLPNTAAAGSFMGAGTPKYQQPAYGQQQPATSSQLHGLSYAEQSVPREQSAARYASPSRISPSLSLSRPSAELQAPPPTYTPSEPQRSQPAMYNQQAMQPAAASEPVSQSEPPKSQPQPPKSQPQESSPAPAPDTGAEMCNEWEGAVSLVRSQIDSNQLTLQSASQEPDSNKVDNETLKVIVRRQVMLLPEDQIVQLEKQMAELAATDKQEPTLYQVVSRLPADCIAKIEAELAQQASEQSRARSKSRPSSRTGSAERSYTHGKPQLTRA